MERRCVTILASSPTRELTPEYPIPLLDERNGFVEVLKSFWRAPARCLMIAAFPDAHGLNDEMSGYYREAVENSSLAVESFDLWDDRREGMSREEFHGYDAVFLAGGHIATEMAWFERIGLRALLEDYTGMVIGTSAGSMNAAQEVYAWPEEPGESFKPVEQLFFPGLGLGHTLVLPHYQKVRESVLDGRRLMEEITCPHSFGRRFYAIPDGSFVLIKGGLETMYGEAWLVSGGRILPFCTEGERRVIPDSNLK